MPIKFKTDDPSQQKALDEIARCLEDGYEIDVFDLEITVDHTRRRVIYRPKQNVSHANPCLGDR